MQLQYFILNSFDEIESEKALFTRSLISNNSEYELDSKIAAYLPILDSYLP